MRVKMGLKVEGRLRSSTLQKVKQLEIWKISMTGSYLYEALDNHRRLSQTSHNLNVSNGKFLQFFY